MGGGGFTLAEAAKQSDAASKKKKIEMLNHRQLSAAGPAGPVADLQSYAGRHCCHETPGKEKKKKNPQTCCHKCDASKLLRTSERQHPHHGRTDGHRGNRGCKVRQSAQSPPSCSLSRSTHNNSNNNRDNNNINSSSRDGE